MFAMDYEINKYVSDRVLDIMMNHTQKVEESLITWFKKNEANMVDIVEYGKIQRYKQNMECLENTRFLYKDEIVFEVQTLRDNDKIKVVTFWY